MHDPQDIQDPPQKFLDLADKKSEEWIETDVDAEHYANGDWDDRIYELACELWAQSIEDEKIAKAEHEREIAKDRQP